MKMFKSVPLLMLAVVVLAAAVILLASERVRTAAPQQAGSEQTGSEQGGSGEFTLATHDGPVLARVDGLPITKGDVDRAIVQMPEVVLSLPEARVRALVLSQLIDNRLLLIAGLEQGLDEDPDVEKLVKMYRASTIAQAYLQQFVAANVSEEAVRARYDETIGNADLQREARAYHILVESEETAKVLIAELDAGADFAELAVQNSVGPSAAQGGDLGYLKRGSVDPAFAEAIFALQPGEIGAVPVQTDFGWHIVRVEDFRDPILPPFDVVRAALRSELTNAAMADRIASLKAEAEIVFEVEQ